MRQRAALILILIAALWAAGYASPAAAQEGPPPEVELPKEKKPKPEKPDVPKGPKTPEEPEEPPAAPEPTEPAPPEVEEPPADGGGTPGTGGAGGGGDSGGDATGGGPGAEPRSSGLGSGRGPASAGAVFGAPAGRDGRRVGTRPEEGLSRARSLASSGSGGSAGPPQVSPRGWLGSFEAGRTAAPPSESTQLTVADEDVAGVGVLPLAVLAVGLAFVSVGLAVGLARAYAGRSWHAPGSRPGRT